MSKKLEWNRSWFSSSHISDYVDRYRTSSSRITRSRTANPALTPFNFKVKECKVDTNPNPVSCKGLKKMINGDTFDLQVSRDNGKIVITLNPTESVRRP